MASCGHQRRKRAEKVLARICLDADELELPQWPNPVGISVIKTMHATYHGAQLCKRAGCEFQE
jgi:hypothetical protein